MGMQRLGAKSIRKIRAAMYDETVTRGWVNNGEDHDVWLFATWDHVHGSWNRATGETRYYVGDDVEHFTSCRDDNGELLKELDPFEKEN